MVDAVLESDHIKLGCCIRFRDPQQGFLGTAGRDHAGYAHLLRRESRGEERGVWEENGSASRAEQPESRISTGRSSSECPDSSGCEPGLRPGQEVGANSLCNQVEDTHLADPGEAW